MSNSEYFNLDIVETNQLPHKYDEWDRKQDAKVRRTLGIIDNGVPLPRWIRWYGTMKIGSVARLMYRREARNSWKKPFRNAIAHQEDWDDVIIEHRKSRMDGMARHW
jgi:hypothetical protein